MVEVYVARGESTKSGGNYRLAMAIEEAGN
jgi:hypothetical protein